MKSIGIVGAGAWGTALAQCYARDQRDVLIWARETAVVSEINDDHENKTFLPGIALVPELKATHAIEDVTTQEILLMVTPAQYMRTTLETLKPHLSPEHIIVICSKGIELESGLLLSQIAEQIIPENKIAIMTGPTFAREIASNHPGAVTVATSDKDTGAALQEALAVHNFRPYLSSDVVGAQLGGAVKNVIAIACGVIHGKKLGESARAALLTRGVAEIARLAVAMGAKKETLLGMCGIGDLMLTCSSPQSRNFSLGQALGEGKTLKEIMAERNSVTEGVHTAQATLHLARQCAVDMPITQAVNDCLTEEKDIEQAIEDMLNRPFKYEMSKK